MESLVSFKRAIFKYKKQLVFLQILKDKSSSRNKFKTKTIKLKVKETMMFMKAGLQKAQ